jgi:predicted nucleic acid-binding protein
MTSIVVREGNTQVVPEKDAPILAAAHKTKLDYLITLDRRHFKQPQVQDTVLFQILLPEEFAPFIRAELAKEASEQGKATEEES